MSDSRGRSLESRAQTIIARGRQNLRRAGAALRTAGPGRTVGDVDLPAELPFDTTVIRGWALPTADATTAVIVSIHGVPHVATCGHARPDVARARPGRPDAVRCGWEVTVDLRDLIGELVQVDVSIVTARGLVEHLPPRTTRVVGRPIVSIDHPRLGGTAAPTFVEVIGTALGTEPVSTVEVVVDGVSHGRARLHAGADPDASRLSLPGSALSRWSTLLDLRDHVPGTPMELEAVVTFASGTVVLTEPVRIGVVPLPDRPVVQPLTGSSSDLDALDVPASYAERQGTPFDPPRILVVTHDLGLGGGQLWLSELLEQLAVRTDWRFVVVAPRDGPLRTQLEHLGCEVHLAGDWPVFDPMEFELRVDAVQRLAADAGCSAVLVNTMNASIGAVVGRRLGVPVVWAIHESFAFDEFFVAAYAAPGAHPSVVETTRDALANANAVVFEADATRALYECEGTPERFVTVRYGVSVAAIDDYRKSHDRTVLRELRGFDDDAFVVLCMGTFEARKSQAMLATAFAQIADDHPSAVLVLVGDRDDPYSDATRAHVESLDLGDRIRVVPVVPDPWEWYLMADLLVSASDLESMPRNVIEAMAFELPVLAADACGVDELVEDGVTGWLCPTRDGGALRNALRRSLRASTTERAAVVSAAREHVSAHHDSAGYGEAFASLLGGLLADRRARPVAPSDERRST